MNDIVKTEDMPQEIVGHEEHKSMGQMLIEMARDESLDAEKLKALIAMKNDEEDRAAKRAFNSALVEFKKNPPRIIKNMAVSFGNTNYKHASIDSVMRQIDPELHKYGLAFTWKINASKEEVCVIGTLRHELGYSEDNVFRSTPDNSGGKNAIQAKGSAVTYGKRYTVLSALGLAEQGEDDDGVKAYAGAQIDESELAELQNAIDATEIDVQALCKHYKVESLNQMSKAQHLQAMGRLKAKMRAVK